MTVTPERIKEALAWAEGRGPWPTYESIRALAVAFHEAQAEKELLAGRARLMVKCYFAIADRLGGVLGSLVDERAALREAQERADVNEARAVRAATKAMEAQAEYERLREALERRMESDDSLADGHCDCSWCVEDRTLLAVSPPADEANRGALGEGAAEMRLAGQEIGDAAALREAQELLGGWQSISAMHPVGQALDQADPEGARRLRLATRAALAVSPPADEAKAEPHYSYEQASIDTFGADPSPADEAKR